MLLKISDLQLNTGQIEGVPTNPRTITEKDFEELKDSLTRNPDNIKKFPLVIAEHKKQLVVISGNQRLRAMQALGWTELEHVGEIYPDGTDPEILKEAVIIANTHKGEWDWDALANDGWEQDDLETWGVDTTQEWATEKDLPDDIDEIPATPKTPVTKLGDLWLLGNHRVLCGDSTDKATVERLMDGKKADMVFTDPPYGIGYDDVSRWEGIAAQNNSSPKKRSALGTIKGDEADFDPSFILDVFSYCKEIFVWGFQYYPDKLGRGGAIVWNRKTKEQEHTPHTDFELCWSKQERNAMAWITWGGFKSKEKNEDRLHPTQKPLELAGWFFERWGKAKTIVVDLFLGSGSTLIACEQTGRNCYGLELDPSYTDVICKRWQTLTGQMPILESTGEAHDFIDVQ